MRKLTIALLAFPVLLLVSEACRSEVYIVKKIGGTKNPKGGNIAIDTSVTYGPDRDYAFQLWKTNHPEGVWMKDTASAPEVLMECTKANHKDKGWWVIGYGVSTERLKARIPEDYEAVFYGCGLQGSYDQVMKAARDFCLGHVPNCQAMRFWEFWSAYDDGQTYLKIDKPAQGSNTYYRHVFGKDGCECRIDPTEKPLGPHLNAQATQCDLPTTGRTPAHCNAFLRYFNPGGPSYGNP